MKIVKSLKETIYNAILEDVLSLKYRPGEILNEKSLMEKYNCSKSPIREALLELCKDNVLRNIPRYGYEVIRLTMDDVCEMIQFRYILESGILRASFENITPAQLDILEEFNQKCHMEGIDVWTHWAYNTEFHLKLISFYRNQYAIEELKRCMDKLRRAYAQFYWDKLDQVQVQLDTKNHTMIIEAIKKKDLNKLLHYLSEDLNDFGGLEYPFIK